MYLLVRKDLDDGSVMVTSDYDWAVLKRRVSDMEWVPWKEWDRLGVWEMLRQGDIIVTPTRVMWQRIDLNELEVSSGGDNNFQLFDGPVVLMADMDLNDDGTRKS